MKRAAHTIAIAGLAVVVWACSSATARPEAPSGTADAPGQTAVIAFQGEAAEAFLREAEITHIEDIDEGVTRPLLVTLQRGGVTHDAVFKSIDDRRPGITEYPDGTIDMDFWDSWQPEVAAYRVDRLIGLGMVPATIERQVRGQVGSLQWWVDSMMTEEERVDRGVHPPDLEAWNRQVLKTHLFDELISNVDRHMNNLLITENFQLRLIDHSRSFRGNRGLRDPDKLTRFSESLLDGLRRLTFEQLQPAIGRYMEDARIERILDRRDAILALVEQRIAEHGRAAVIYP